MTRRAESQASDSNTDEHIHDNNNDSNDNNDNHDNTVVTLVCGGETGTKHHSPLRYTLTTNTSMPPPPPPHTTHDQATHIPNINQESDMEHGSRSLVLVAKWSWSGQPFSFPPLPTS